MALAGALALLLVVPGVQGTGPLAASFAAARVDGGHSLAGELSGLALQSASALDAARLSVQGQRLELRTANYTAAGAASVAGYAYDQGGADLKLGAFSLAAGPTATGLDVLLVPLAGKPAPVFTGEAAGGELRLGATDTVKETVRVSESRPLLEGRVAGHLESSTAALQRFTVEGSFALSVWAWNLTVDAAGAPQQVVTGSYRQVAASDPVLKLDAAYTEYAQVAQLVVHDGRLEVDGIEGATARLFAARLAIDGVGSVQVESATGLAGDDSGVPLAPSALLAKGEYAATASSLDGQAILEFSRLVGSLDVDGAPVALGGSGPLRGSTTVSAPLVARPWVWVASLLGLFTVTTLLTGPAKTHRFRRLQERFDRKDYAGLLGRIDPFTRHPRFRRRATFLKAVSLLSLQEYQEASLFLQTLAPHEGPEPATKAFLQACAAAGLGQDSSAIAHLSECLKGDPTYAEEAKTVPVLAGYLAYFTVDPEGAAT